MGTNDTDGDRLSDDRDVPLGSNRLGLDSGGDGARDLQGATSGIDPAIVDHQGLGSVDDELFADPPPARCGAGTVSLDVRPTPSEPDDSDDPMVVAPPPPPPVDLIDEI